MKHVPFEAAPKGSYHSFGDIQDQMLVNRLGKGEILTQHHLLDAGPEVRTTKMPPGCIPCTVRIDPFMTWGFALPRDRMDVIHVRNSGTDHVKATTVLEKVLILAQEDNIPLIEGKAEALLVVAVYPDQAKLLRKLGSQGRLGIHLPPYGNDKIGVRPVTVKELLREQKEK